MWFPDGEIEDHSPIWFGEPRAREKLNIAFFHQTMLGKIEYLLGSVNTTNRGMEAHLILTGLREVPLGPTEATTGMGDEDSSIYYYLTEV